MWIEQVNELYLKIKSRRWESVITKTGAFVAGKGSYRFEKLILGPEDNRAVALMNQVGRRLTGENMQLTRVQFESDSETYYASQAKHVQVIDLTKGSEIKVESENLLAFNSKECNYGFVFELGGVLAQRGLFTTKITALVDTKVAIITNGNPLMLETPCVIDPDTLVAYSGDAPSLKWDLNWKTAIGQTSGETYSFEFTRPGEIVIIQPYERVSGLHIGIDDRRQDRNEQNNSVSLIGAIGGVGELIGGRQRNRNDISQITRGGIQNIIQSSRDRR